jgi:predicted alpha/beta superfamily hydrolase
MKITNDIKNFKLQQMNNSTLLKILMLLLFCKIGSIYAQETAQIKELVIDSKVLQQKRPIYIYLPAEYEERELVSFDVIYVFDAQHRAIFDLVHAAMDCISFKKKFIVVGISSPAYVEQEYYRNSDFLPKPINVSLEEYNTDKPNAENFWRFIQEEVMPFVTTNFRTSTENYAVGHSLSASFILDKAIKTKETFKGTICISPNLAYDKNRLLEDFTNFNFEETLDPKFIYISEANEKEIFGKKWEESYDKLNEFIEKSANLGKYSLVYKEFPTYNHLKTVLPALSDALELLHLFIEKNPSFPSGDSKEITIKLTVLNKEDEAYISGNQKSLGNWNPSAVKFNVISDYERELRIKVQFPMEFKITKGNWESEVYTNLTTNNAENILINKLEKDTLHLKITSW